MASEEILHFRDWRLSERHRDWYGEDCPIVDLDFAVIEYDHCTPVALVEYKHALRRFETLRETAGIKAFRALASMAELPAWVAYYRPEGWSYQIVPLNPAARTVFGNDDFISLTETEYVEALHAVRGRVVPTHVLAHLNNTLGRHRTDESVGPFAHRRLVRKKMRPNVPSLCHFKRKARAKQ